MYSKTLQKDSFFKGCYNLNNLITFFIKRYQLVIHRIASILRKDTWKIEAEESLNQPKISIHYVGAIKERNYLSKLFFSNGYKYTFLGKQWLWQVLFDSHQKRKDFDFSVIHTKYQFAAFARPLISFCLPCWVGGNVDLSVNFEMELKHNKMSKRSLRRIRNSSFNLDISRDLFAFDDFYYNMYKPYLSQRHKGYAVIESYDKLKEVFVNSGEILFAKMGSKRIAGHMISYQEGNAIAFKMGVLNGEHQWVKDGVISFLYYHSLKHCTNKGYTKLDLGGSRPFFSDGVLRYKLNNWNMKIKNYSKRNYFIIKPLKCSVDTKLFLLRNPFISIKKNKMIANIFFDGPIDDQQLIDKKKNLYSSRGFSSLNLYSFSSYFKEGKSTGLKFFKRIKL